MSCDAGRPCGRCVKRDIAHLCREEPTTTAGPGTPTLGAKAALPSTSSTPVPSGSGTGNGFGHGGAGAGVDPPSPVMSTSEMGRTPPPPPSSIGLTSPGLTGLSNPGLSQPNLSFAPAYNAQLPMLTNNFNLAMVRPRHLFEKSSAC